MSHDYNALVQNHEYICPGCGTTHKREVSDAATYTLEHKRRDLPSFPYQVLVCKACAKKSRNYEVYSRIFGGILSIITFIGTIVWFVFFFTGGAVPILGFFVLAFFPYWIVRKLSWRILFKVQEFSLENAKLTNALYNGEL